MSLQQCNKILFQYPIVIAAPESLDVSNYTNHLSNSFTVRFNDVFFENIEGYNRLMLSKGFYKQFSDYRYILLYQLDAWIFKDDINFWCSKNYDYIGAPWVEHPWASFAAEHFTFLRTVFYKLGYRKFNTVGNGGFSLRKVNSTLHNLSIFKNAVKKFKGNEDYFFSFHINSYNPFFKIPSIKEALQFSFDINAQQSFALNNNKLPMGCHAWDKQLDFWKQFIKITN